MKVYLKPWQIVVLINYILLDINNMNKTKIKVDKHGLFIKANGGIYRPQMSKHSYATYNNNYGVGIETKLNKGDVVKVNVIRQTPFCKLITADIVEYWNSHESNNIDSKDSEDYWMPKGL